MNPDERIAYLEARVEALEDALSARSHELRALQRHLPAEGLTLLARIHRGLPPLPELDAYDPELWHETTEFQPADVGDTLQDLWRSLAPSEAAGDEHD